MIYYRLIETFGEKEVDEAFRIIDNKYKNPELEKLFYRENKRLHLL